MRLRFTRRAIQDLTEIADFLGAHDPAAARRVQAAILRTVENVAWFPWSGRRQDVEGVRKSIVRRFPYMIFYPVDDAAEEVSVLAIRPASRKRAYSDA